MGPLSLPFFPPTLAVVGAPVLLLLLVVLLLPLGLRLAADDGGEKTCFKEEAGAAFFVREGVRTAPPARGERGGPGGLPFKGPGGPPFGGPGGPPFGGPGGPPVGGPPVGGPGGLRF